MTADAWLAWCACLIAAGITMAGHGDASAWITGAIVIGALGPKRGTSVNITIVRERRP